MTRQVKFPFKCMYMYNVHNVYMYIYVNGATLVPVECTTGREAQMSTANEYSMC